MPSKKETSTHLPAADGSGQMFDGIAAQYDRLNRMMSFGLDRLWRRRLVASVADAVAAQQRTAGRACVLDVATGTADVALALARTYEHLTIVGVDPSTKMLELGRSKVARDKLTARIALTSGTAEQLPAEASGACAATISFGIRNFPDRLAALEAIKTRLVPGGRIAILELGEPTGGLLAPLARFHVHQLVPMLGRMLSGKEAYAYLAQSIAKFLSPEAFVALMQQAGYVNVRAQRLSFGAVHLFVGDVPHEAQRA